MYRTVAVYRALAVVAASSVGLALAALPAEAAPLQYTGIVQFAASVTTVAYQQPVTFTGELITVGDKAPVPNEPIQLLFQPPQGGQFATVAAGTTGSDGRFTITTALPSGGHVLAEFPGDAALASSVSTPSWGLQLRATTLPSRLVPDPVPHSVPAGTPVTFAGTLQVQVGGDWQPFAGAPLTLLRGVTGGHAVAAQLTSGPDGRFSTVRPAGESSDWILDLGLNDAYYTGWYPAGATVDYGVIFAVSRTRVSAFAMPARDEAHHAWYKGMYASGAVERWNGAAWVPQVDSRVDFYHRAKGSKVWRSDFGAETDANGRFRSLMSVYLGTSEWQVRVHPSTDALTSTSATAINTITDRTHVAHASVDRNPRWTLIAGQITDWYDGQVTFSTLGGLKVKVYDRRAGSSTWRLLKTVVLDRDGFFSLSLSGSYRRGYAFRFVLPAQGPYLSCTSRIL